MSVSIEQISICSMLDSLKEKVSLGSLTQFETLLLSELFLKLQLKNYVDRNVIETKTILDKMALGHHMYELSSEIPYTTDDVESE